MPSLRLRQLLREGVDEGLLALDSDELSTALQTDTPAVRELLGGDGTTNGIFSQLAVIIDEMTEEETGPLATREDGFDTQIRSLDLQIERLEVRLAQREEVLFLQFTQLETTLANLQAQGSSLAALTFGNNNNNSGN